MTGEQADASDHERGNARYERLGDLIRGFAHEIKNPLSTIGLNLRLMEEELSEQQSPREKQFLVRTRRLAKEVERVQGVLDGFLGFLRAPEPHLVRCSLNDVVREVVDLVGPGLESQGLRLHAYLAEGLPECMADPSLLHQVLQNLIRNSEQALIHSDRRGEILVSTGQIEIDGKLWHSLSVIDGGPGMAPEVLEQCFEPYYSTKRGGSGLGLAITRRFIEDQGGTIEVESTIGTGTKFRILLPSERDDVGEGETT